MWLPEDRDIVAVYHGFEKSRRACGHWSWQEGDVEGLEPGYTVCGMCAELNPYAEGVRKQNRARGEDEHGLTFGWFTPRGDADAD